MTLLLRLFVTGQTQASIKAIRNLNVILKGPELKGKYKLEVIDILRHPQLAEDEKILATPVLERKLPTPVKRIIGDLNEKEKVLLGLDLIEEAKINKVLKNRGSKK